MRRSGSLAALAALVVAVAFPFVVDDAADVRMVSLGLVLAVAAMGLNVLTGLTGQISIGHAAFYGLGAFVSAQLTIETALTFSSTIPVAVAVAALAGAVVGLPALRVRGPALALVTLGLALVVPTLLRKYGAPGRSALWQPRRRDLASPFEGVSDTQWKYLVPLAAVVLVYLALRNLVRSRAGRALIAVRDNEVPAATAGVNVALAKIAAFALSAACCGLAGALSVLVRGQADASSALSYFQLSIYFLVAVVVGGVATNGGPILGALVVQVLIDKAPEWGGHRAGLAPFILGTALVALLFVMPDGIFGGARRLQAAMRRGRSAPSAGPAPSPLSPSPIPDPKEAP